MDNKLYGWISMRGVHYNPLGIEVCSTRSGTAPGDSRTTPHPPGQQARIGNSAAHLCGEVHALRTHCRGRHRGAPHPGVHNLSLPHSRSAMLHLDSAPSCARMWALPDSTRLATRKYRVLLPRPCAHGCQNIDHRSLHCLEFVQILNPTAPDVGAFARGPG